MTTAAPRIVFLPVSSPKGIGEYMRSLIIAEALIKQDPTLDIQFVLNRHAPAAASCPFKTHLLNNSATKEKAAVNQLLAELKNLFRQGQSGQTGIGQRQAAPGRLEQRVPQRLLQRAHLGAHGLHRHAQARGGV